MLLADNPLGRKYLLLARAEHGQVSVVRNMLERRPSNTLAHLLGRKPRLSVTDDRVADFDKVHFRLYQILIKYILDFSSTNSTIGLSFVSSYR